MQNLINDQYLLAASCSKLFVFSILACLPLAELQSVLNVCLSAVSST